MIYDYIYIYIYIYRYIYIYTYIHIHTYALPKDVAWSSDVHTTITNNNKETSN